MERALIKRLRDWRAGKRKPLILRGARQVGKTYILKKFGKEFPRAHYINFEQDQALHSIYDRNFDCKRILNELSLFLKTSIKPETDLLILDEIQDCPSALTSLKYFAEDMPGFSICAAGSLLGVTLAPVSFPVGKVSFLDMYPLSFEEFLSALNLERYIEAIHTDRLDKPLPEFLHQELWEVFKQYLFVGGLPEVVLEFRELLSDLTSAFTNVRAKQHDLVRTYESDMAKHSGKQNSMHLSRLWSNVPNQLARSQDGSASRFRFKDVVPGIKGYGRLAGGIDWLSNAGLILRTSIIEKAEQPLSAYVSDNRFKLYSFDVGMLGALSSLQAESIMSYDYGSYKGYYAENFVAQEFIANGEKGLYCWARGKAEIEFLRVFANTIHPIEVKSGWVTQSKSIKVFCDKYPQSKAIVLSARNLEVDRVRKKVYWPLYLAGRLTAENIYTFGK